MKKKIRMGIVVAIVLIAAYFYAHIDKNIYLYDRTLDSSEFVGTGVLCEGDEITQTFAAAENWIDGINVKATIVGNVEKCELEYEILEKNTGHKESGVIQGSDIQNNKFNLLKIDRLENTKNKEYVITLREIGSDELNGINFYLEPADDTNEVLTVKGETIQGNLMARTISHQFDIETFVVLIGFILFVSIFLNVLYRLFK